MNSLIFVLEAEQELDALWEIDQDAAALIEELLCQLEENPALLDELCREHRHVTHDPAFQVKRFRFMWDDGYTIYILKIWPEYGREIHHRVLYAHHPQKHVYYVLTIMQRDLDYESDKILIKRLVAAYEELGVPRYH